jgi:hypothetical protein
MTRDDIIRMAREAGMTDSPDDYNAYWTADSIDELERFANLIAAAEREACCAIVYGQCDSDNVAQRTADAIRARSE